MPKRNRLTLFVLVALYLLTWVGGWSSHAEQLRAEAGATYRHAEHLKQGEAGNVREDGGEYRTIRLHADGPHAGVSWCIPVLPGILLADSYYSLGPLGGRGGLKIVLYYGAGSEELCMLWGWIS